MKKLLAILAVALTLTSTMAEAGRYGGSFGGSRSFSSFRSYSRPSMPRYTTPRPVVKRTTVIQNNHVTQNTGTGILGTVIGAGVGSYVGTRLAQPSQSDAPAQQYPLCPKPVPAGWNTPCIPQSN